MIRHTGASMPKTKLAVTLDSHLVGERDKLIRGRRFANRSQAIVEAVAEELQRLAQTRLARECARLVPSEERALAEEGLAGGRAHGPRT